MSGPESKKDSDEKLIEIGRVNELAEHPDADQLEKHLGESGRRLRRASDIIHGKPDEELQ